MEPGFLAGILLRVERFAVAREAIADPDIVGSGGSHLDSEPLRGDQPGDSAVAGFGVPNALAEKKNAGSGKFAERAFGHLNQRERRIGDRAKHVRERHHRARNIGCKILRIGGHITRRVNVDADAFCLLGIELQVAGDKCAMLRGAVALKGIQNPRALDGVFLWQGRRSSGFAGAGNRKIGGNVQPECGGVAVGRIVG